MEEIEAMMADLAKRFGQDGMRAIATLMYNLGSDATISLPDDTYLPCDFLMQMAWANGGQPVASE
ncbi:hypothetical protein ACVWZ4_007229 [Bradyrhizobium sp. USDA 4472]